MNVWARRRTPPRMALVVALACLLGGCGGSGVGTSHHTSAGSKRATVISSRRMPRVGRILVNAKHRPLYMFVPDNQRKVTCVHVSCTGTWPPVELPAGAHPKAGPGVKSSLLSSVSDPAGGRVVTYNKWPLYTYKADIGSGSPAGQAVDSNGGPWYVIRPDGQPVIPHHGRH